MLGDDRHLVDAPSGSKDLAPPSPKGVGGWLVLPVIGLVVTPLRHVGLFFEGGFGGFAEMVAGVPAFVSAYLLFGVIGNVLLLLVVPVGLIVLLVLKKRIFIRAYAGWGLASVGFVVLDLALAMLLFPRFFPTFASLFGPETNFALFRAVVLAGIWVPYMLLSRRAANTFVN